MARGIATWLAAAALSAVAMSTAAQAQCSTMCGDWNGDGIVSSADVINYVHYLYPGGTAAFDTSCTDIDGYELVTIRDLIWLTRYIFWSGPLPTCPPDSARFVPGPSPDIEITYGAKMPPAGSMHGAFHELHIGIVNRTGLSGMTIPLAIKFDDQPAIISESPIYVTDQWHQNHAIINPLGDSTGTLLIGLVHFMEFDTGSHHAVILRVWTDPFPPYHDVTVEWISTPPLQNGLPVNYPMVVDTTMNTWEPVLKPCPVQMNGDVRWDGAIGSSDIIWLVSYVFKGGPEPGQCVASGDVNCSGAVTSADIIRLVEFVFKGGEMPCNVCGLIPDVWTCP